MSVLEEVTMVNKANSNEQIDVDILQCKVDILRASDIIPPYKKKIRQKRKLQNNTVPIEPLRPKETAVLAAGRESTATQSEIPKFDLAEEIMAEQRKVTSIRRKSPGQKNEAQKSEPKAERVDYTIERPTPMLPKQEQIVAEIVARDIEGLCRSDTSVVQR